MSHITVQLRGFTCLVCGVDFVEEILLNVTISLWVARLKEIRCPKCNASWDRVAFKFFSDDAATIGQITGERPVSDPVPGE